MPSNSAAHSAYGTLICQCSLRIEILNNFHWALFDKFPRREYFWQVWQENCSIKFFPHFQKSEGYFSLSRQSYWHRKSWKLAYFALSKAALVKDVSLLLLINLWVNWNPCHSRYMYKAMFFHKGITNFFMPSQVNLFIFPALLFDCSFPEKWRISLLPHYW